MKYSLHLVRAALALASATVAFKASADPVGYQLDVTTTYGIAGPAGFFGLAPSPDTGFFIVTNDGTSVFTGSVGDLALSGDGGNYNQTQNGVTLNPGQSIAFSVNEESSNHGGFNGPTGSTQPGVEILINGLINGTEGVNLGVFDSQIHSGVPQTDPFGVTTDSYVLQGGDPNGFDTGDAFEEAQANGHFSFFEAGPVQGVPDASSSAALLMIAAGCLGAGRRFFGRAS